MYSSIGTCLWNSTPKDLFLIFFQSNTSDRIPCLRNLRASSLSLGLYGRRVFRIYFTFCTAILHPPAFGHPLRRGKDYVYFFLLVNSALPSSRNFMKACTSGS